jgi:hypothetical protein
MQTFESLHEPDSTVFAHPPPTPTPTPKLRPSEDLQACLARIDKMSLKSRYSAKDSPDVSNRHDA